MDHPSLVFSEYSTIILSWFNGAIHFFEAPPKGQGFVILEAYYASYFLCFLISYGLYRRWQKQGSLRLIPSQLTDVMLFGIFGVFVGARLVYALFYNLEFFLREPWAIFGGSGMASHGAILGVVGFLIFYARRYRLSSLHLLDHAAIGACIGAITIRIANFLNGELYGRSSDLPWAMRFPMRDGLGRPLFIDESNQVHALEYASPENGFGYLRLLEKEPQHSFESFGTVVADFPSQLFRIAADTPEGPLKLVARLVTDPSHPSQLYQMFLSGVVLLVALLWIRSKKLGDGFVTGSFLALYGLSRIFTEFFRQPDPQRSEGLFQILSMGQILSLGLIVAGAIVLRYSYQNNRVKPG